MGEALLFGLIASSGLLLGSFVGARWNMPTRVLAFLLAFASGALITALAFELFEDAYRKSGAWVAGIGFFVGAAVFVAVSTWLDRRVAAAGGPETAGKMDKDAATDAKSGGPASATAGFALLAAVTLDGVPENLALGISLGGETGSIALLLAIFASNFPESLVGAAQMRDAGYSVRFAVGIWIAAAIVLAAAVVVGEFLVPPETETTISLPLAFAGGAVIASLADTLMPEAFEGGGPLVAFATVGGFFLSYVLATL